MLRIPFSDDDFSRIRTVVANNAGINLTERKRELVYGRLWKRIRDLGMTTFSDYCEELAKPDSLEVEYCINAITTNVTSFFREPHHFEYLTQWLQDEDRKPGRKRLRIWSAGCSSGQEPYSIALTILGAAIDHAAWDIEVLATDIDSDILAAASKGVYPVNRQAGLSKNHLKWFQRGIGENDGLMRAKASVRQLVQFRALNLFGDWAGIEDNFDFIFCRNVIIYFTSADRTRLLERFSEKLKLGGHLVLGHSESLHGVESIYKIIGKTISVRIQ